MKFNIQAGTNDIKIMRDGDSHEGMFLFGLDRGIHGLPGGTGTLTIKKNKNIYN